MTDAKTDTKQKKGFTDVNLPVIEFTSYARQTSTLQTQTESIAVTFDSKETQTQVSALRPAEKTAEEQVQTQYDGPYEKSTKKGEHWVHEEKKIEEKVNDSMDDSIHEELMDTEYLQFVLSAGEEMSLQLELNMKTQVLSKYDVDWENYSQHVSCLYSLQPPVIEEGTALQVTCVSWSCNGATLAVSYGRVDINGWCNSKGYVGTWNISRKEVQKPEILLESDNCVQCIQFHPEDPAMLCGGTYNGDFLIWDIAKENDYLTFQSDASLSDNISHTDPVTQVQWILNERPANNKKRYLIITSSGDGKVLVWGPQKSGWAIIGLYEIRTLRNVSGVNSFDFLKTSQRSTMGDKTIANLEECVVIIGCESGAVHKGQIRVSQWERDGPVANNKPANPVQFTYKEHRGPCNYIHCSPNNRHMFLTASSDGTVRIYTVYDKEYTHEIIPGGSLDSYIYDAKWSPTQPWMIACACRDSHLYLFDIAKSVAKPIFSTPASKAALLCVQFNTVATNLLATGDSLGVVNIWDLGMFS